MPVSADRLRELLEELEAHWNRLGLPIADTAAPGATADQISAAESATGLRLPEEARVWYRWHDGNGDVPWAGFEAMPGWRLVSLEHGVALREQNMASVADLGGDEQFSPHWFPIAMAGGLLVVDTSGDTDEPAPVDVFDPAIGLPADVRTPKWPSLTAFLEEVIELFDGGWIGLHPEHQSVYFPHYENLPDKYLGYAW